MKNFSEDWYPIPKNLNDISAILDGEREFLEAIAKFRDVEKRVGLPTVGTVCQK